MLGFIQRRTEKIIEVIFFFIKVLKYPSEMSILDDIRVASHLNGRLNMTHLLTGHIIIVSIALADCIYLPVVL